MQSKGEENKSSHKISKIQAKSKELWEIESRCKAWVVLTCVAVCLNCIPQGLKNALMFFPHSCPLALSNCFQLDVSRTHFSQVCSYSVTCSFFLSVGLGGGGSAPCNVRSWVEPCRGTAPVATSAPALAQPRLAVLIPPFCPHTYTNIQAGKVLPKTAGISLGESTRGDCYCKDLRGSRYSGSTVAVLPQYLWAWRFSLMRNGNIDACVFYFLNKKEGKVSVTFRD